LPPDLNPSNRPVRTRMPGGVAGDLESQLQAPMPIPETLMKEPISRGVLGTRFRGYDTECEAASSP